MSEKKLYIIGLPILALFVFGIIGLSNNNEGSNIVIDGTTIKYSSNVCTSVLREDGTYEDNGCSHNVLYTTGKELIEVYLGDTGGGTDEVDQISLCNATAGCETPVAGKTEAFTVMNGCGLAETTGTYLSNGDGNWSITNTFTATCDNLLTNTTRLGNTNNDDFAGNAFTLVTLQTNDQILVNWTCATT